MSGLHKFRSGDRVRVVDDIKQTAKRFGLDGQGHMKAMQGKVFKILQVVADAVHIDCEPAGRSFSFYIKDVNLITAISEKPEQNFKFDEHQLVT